MEPGPAELRLQLEDAQTSLAAALARIETLKVREKILTQEVAQLRKQLAGGSRQATPRGDRSPSPHPPTAEEQQQAADGAAEQQAEPPENNIMIGMPLYITELKDQQPVVIHTGSRLVRARCARGPAGDPLRRRSSRA
jgi:hypothetical protein